MRKIIVVGDASSTNLGDPILTSCCRFVVDKAVRELGISKCEIEIFDIADRKKQSVPVDVVAKRNISPNVKSSRGSSIRNSLLIIKNLVKWFLHDQKNFKKRLHEKGISKSSIIIIAGGALISSSSFYALRIREIIRISEKIGCKVIFNSIGIEKSLDNSLLVRQIVRGYLKSKNIIGFSTRDHIEDVKKITKREDFKKMIPCSALFAAEVYRNQDLSKNELQCVGISVISFDAYKSVAKNDSRVATMSPGTLLSFWSSLIKKLQERNVRFKILANGGAGDYAMALRLVDLLGLDSKEVLLPLAQSPEELIKQLDGFSAILAHRLHACIISASLGKTLVPIIWSNKVLAFAKMIGNEMAFWPNEECEDVIVDYLCYSQKVSDITELKNQSLDFLKFQIEKSLH